MRDCSRGVSYYTRGTVSICFPEDDICCSRCPLLGVEMASSRKYCRRTGEYLPSPDYVIGTDCPISFEKENEE